MRCDTAERLILLERSGELSGRRLARVTRHLVGCAACRGYQADVERVCSAAAARPAGEAPGAAVLARILAAAEVGATAARPLRFPRSLAHALAWAAVLALLLGGWQAALARRRAALLGEVSALLSIAAENPAGAGAATPGQGAEDPFRTLARDLLIAEGLSVEMAEAEEAPGVSPEADREPTVLRWRSTLSPPARRCV